MPSTSATIFLDVSNAKAGQSHRRTSHGEPAVDIVKLRAFLTLVASDEQRRTALVSGFAVDGIDHLLYPNRLVVLWGAQPRRSSVEEVRA
jgi:hypothetical protein